MLPRMGCCFLFHFDLSHLMDPRIAVQNEGIGRTQSTYTVLALKFVYYLDGKKAAMSSMLDDTSMIAYKKIKG
jgi:hypothetical protein